MKYCPYCGAELCLGAVSFCQECGKSLPEKRGGAFENPTLSLISDSARTPLEPFVVREELEAVSEKRKVEWTIPHQEQKKPDEKPYDGYYDDVVPEDDMIHEIPKANKSTILKIVGIVFGVIAIAGICIVALFLL